MKIPQPFLPLRVESHDLCHTAYVLGRSYTFGPDGLISSVVADGRELLAAPMRIVLKEDGTNAVFDDNYPDNESECFLQHRSEEGALICGCKQSERFLLNVSSRVEYDGNVDIDLRVMSRGMTVAQSFGVEALRPQQYILDKLYLEVPLKKEICSLFHIYPNSPLYFADGSVRKETVTSMSGALPDKPFSLPFKPLLWLGDEERGLGWFAESERGLQIKDPRKVIEVIPAEQVVTLRIHLLEGQPAAWKEDPAKGYARFAPLSFHFGFQATPVKPFPKDPYLHNALHLDCGKKIRGNYGEFLAAENRFDRLREMGVTTLILHEKWNKSQNSFDLSEFTAAQLRYIVDECHKRGIRVLPYFGFEFSTLNERFAEWEQEAVLKNADGEFERAWWRVPFQRALIACYNSSLADRMVEGIARLMDTYHFDGIYLDSTAKPRLCHNTEHGCGWYDNDGNLRGSYPIRAIRRLFQRLYAVVKERGGHINIHNAGVLNFTALPYADQCWYGENLQSAFMQGKMNDVNLDYFRTEYIGRNMGVPVEFIVYENRPLWSFENALSCALLHGILPRPNDIGEPLEMMSGIWRIIGGFPIGLSEWCPYWANSARSDHPKVRISYYRYTTLTGETQLLAFVVNVSSDSIRGVTLRFEENAERVTDAKEGKRIGLTFDLPPYGHKILFIG